MNIINIMMIVACFFPIIMITLVIIVTLWLREREIKEFEKMEKYYDANRKNGIESGNETE